MAKGCAPTSFDENIFDKFVSTFEMDVKERDLNLSISLLLKNEWKLQTRAVYRHGIRQAIKQ